MLQVLENAPTHVMVAAVQKHSKSIVSVPPLKPLTPASSDVTPDDLEARLIKLVNASPVMLFMKGTPDAPRCGFSKKV